MTSGIGSDTSYNYAIRTSYIINGNTYNSINSSNIIFRMPSFMTSLLFFYRFVSEDVYVDDENNTINIYNYATGNFDANIFSDNNMKIIPSDKERLFNDRIKNGTTSSYFDRLNYCLITTNIEQIADSNFKLSNGFSFTSWIRLKTLGETHVMISDNSTNINSNTLKFSSDTISDSNNLPSYTVGNNMTPINTFSSNILKEIWVHLGIVINLTNIYLYVNGNLKHTFTDNTNIIPRYIFIGKSPIPYSSSTDFYCYNFKVFCTALSQPDITRLYNYNL